MKKILLISTIIFTGLFLTACEDDTPESLFEVKFSLDNDSIEDNDYLQSVVITENEKVSEPSAPTKDHNEFINWYCDGKEYNFNTKVTKNLDIYGTWNELTIIEECHTIDDLQYTLYSNGEASVKKDYYAQNVFSADIKSTITFNDIEYTVTSIRNNAFFNWTVGNSLTIPNTITHIGSEAFFRCNDLREITIPASVEVISYGAFESCQKLETVNINANIKSIAYDTFKQCESLTTVNMSNTITSIGNNAFYECTALTNINIPNSVNTIGYSAFYNCTSLESIVIPSGVTTIQYNTFSGCSSLSSVTLSSSLNTIESHAFVDCTSLRTIFIPKSVTTMGNYIFEGCTNLTIKVEANSQPKNWEASWNVEDFTVEWGASN